MSKNVLIVGGTSGIGQHLTNELIEQDHTVTVIARNRNNLPEKVKFLPFDVSDMESSLPTIEGTLDAFIYMPGTINLKPFTQMQMQDFENDMKINFFAAARLIKNYIPILNSDSSIVLCSSVAASTGLSYHTSISAAKSAVEGFAKALAAEMAPKIRVNTVAPSITQTRLSEKLLNTDEKKQTSAKSHPMQRIGTCQDISNAISFLISDKSTWITGQTMHVDGGFSSLRHM